MVMSIVKFIFKDKLARTMSILNFWIRNDIYTKQKNQLFAGPNEVEWQCPNFPGRFQPSILGDEKLNFRVRDDNGWFLLSMFTIHGIITDFTDIIK